ncbi:MAG TPA: hypothetical protein VMU84_02060 [Thermoanaerobaculia bacterium]|nr:hypothetical protein [Thermoanaerobaculia bacterium]
MLDSTRAIDALNSVERRRFGRIRLDETLSARYGEAPVRILEVSVLGFRIAHEQRLQIGASHALWLAWDERKIGLDCTVVRTHLWRLAKSMGERSIYHSGLRITHSIGDSYDILRELVADRIIRAIEEQKANARGIPPLAAYMYQPGKGDLFRRCEFIDGRWRKSETTHSEQPRNGFTISVDVDPQHVQILCDTWEQTTPAGRKLTQLLAELSISKKEGVPTRRYVP